MATVGGTLAKKRDRKTIIEKDRFYRLEITSTNADYMYGDVYVRKDILDALTPDFIITITDGQ
jgi:hypothetical protein